MKRNYIIPLAIAVCVPLTAHAVLLLAHAVLLVFSAAADTPADPQPVFDACRSELDNNNGAASASDPKGHRSILWDASRDAVSDPRFIPAGFFFNQNAINTVSSTALFPA